MPQPEYLDVDPRVLRLPGSRLGGADPYKLQRQIAAYGSGQSGMPPPWVYRGSDGALMLNANGSFDTTFDNNGISVTALGGVDSGNAVALQNDGKIVVAGSANASKPGARCGTKVICPSV